MTDRLPSNPELQPAKHARANLLTQAGQGVAALVLAASSALGQASGAAEPTATPPADAAPTEPAPPATAPAPPPPAAPALTRTVAIVSRDSAGLIAALRAALPEGFTATASESPDAILIGAPTDADLVRVEALVDALDRVDLSAEGVVFELFAPARTNFDETRRSLVALLGSGDAVPGLALGTDPRGTRLVLRGARARVDQAIAVLKAIDADPARESEVSKSLRGEFAALRVPLASPDAARTAAQALVTERMRREMRVATSPDGRALIAAGDAADLALWRAALATTDGADANARAARLVRLSSSDAPRVLLELREQLAARRPAAATVATAAAAGRSAAGPLLELDPAARELLIVGTAADLAETLDLVRRIEGGRALERETALVSARGAAADLARLCAQMAAEALPQLGSEPARFEPIDALGAVLVAGEPGTIDFAVAVREASMARTPSPRAVRELRAPAAVVATALERSRPDAARSDLSVDIDAFSRTIRVAGTVDAVDGFERALLEARGLRQPHRTARIVPAGARVAADAAVDLQRLLGAAVPIDAARSIPLAEVRPLPSIGALFISGEAAQIALLARVHAAHESGALTPATPLRLLEVRCTDARAVATGLRERFDARGAIDRSVRPVLAEGDERSGAVAVALHPDMLAEVARAIDALDTRDDGTTAQPREVFSSTLAQSDPAVVARALNGLFALAPMPRDAFGHALPHLRECRELFATADPSTRMVWVEAARDRAVPLDGIVGQLDRLALPADAEVRLFRLERGDITRVVQNLRDLAARGSLSTPAAEGTPAPALVIDADPMSRTLIVVGDGVAFAKTEEVLRQLGVLTAPRAVRVIDAGGLDPEQLRLRALRLAALEPVGDESPAVVTTADPVRGVVTAVGDEESLERFAVACQRIVPRAGDALSAVALELAHRDARSIAATLDGVTVGRTSRVAIEAASERVVVLAGSREAVTGAALIVRALDEPSAAPAKSPSRTVAVLPARDAALPAQAIAKWLEARGSGQQPGDSADIEADPDGDRLIVSASPQPMGHVSAIVRDLGFAESQDQARMVQVLPLERARADDLARLLSLEPVGNRPSKWRETAVRADEERNALVLAGPVQQVATLAILAEDLDRPAASDALPLFVSGGGEEQLVLPIQTVAIERAAELVRALLGGVFVTDAATEASQAPVSVGVDAANRRLLVAAPEGFCELAKAIVARIDGADTARGPLQVAMRGLVCAELPLKHVDADVAARVVESIIGDRTRWPESLNAAVRDGARVVSPSVVADAAQRRIFVSAAPQLMELAARAVERLDAPRAAGSRWEMRVYPISRELLSPAAVAARSALKARQREGSPPPRVELDALSEGEALVATGEPSWLDVVDSAVRSVEVRGPRDAARVRVVSLARGSAAQLAALPGALLAGKRSRTVGPADTVSIEVRAVPDARANAVALLATPFALDFAEEILLELDADPNAPNARSLRLYELTAGEAAVAAKSIVDLFETDDGEDPLPTVRVYPSRNSLLVRATDKQRVTIDGLVARADPTAPARARFVRVLRIGPDPRRVEEVAAVTARILDPRAEVRLATDGAGNRLVVFGDEDGIARASAAAGQVLDLAGTIDARARLRELPASADPRAIGQLARAALGALRLDRRTGEVVARRVVLADRAEPRAIALIASDRDARIADAVIEMLVRGQAIGPFALRAITLERADATRVAGALREQAARADGTLLIVDDAASRTIVLLGAPTEVDQASRAAARVDRSADTAPEEVRLLPLRALRCEDALRLLAPLSAQGGATVLIAQEPASNALVLRGEPARLAAMGELLARLDDPAAKNFAPFEVVRPAHLSPSALAAAVEALVCGAEPARRERMRLVADDATGLLFVRVDPALVADVRTAIAAADVPPPPPPPPPPPVDVPAAPAEAPAAPAR